MESNEAEIAAGAQVEEVAKAMQEEQEFEAPQTPREDGQVRILVFCCFFSRFGRCKFGSRCKYIHDFTRLDQNDTDALNAEPPTAKLVCERIQILGECRHLENREHD